MIHHDHRPELASVCPTEAIYNILVLQVFTGKAGDNFERAFRRPNIIVT